MVKRKIPEWIQVSEAKFVIKVGPRGHPVELNYFETKKDADLIYLWGLQEQKKLPTSSPFTKPQKVTARTFFVRALDPVPEEVLKEYDRRRAAAAEGLELDRLLSDNKKY